MLYPVPNRSKTAFIDPRFLIAAPFSKGYAFASLDGETFGFIKLTGAFAVSPQFQQCRSFSEGLAPVCRDEQWGYINHQGALEIPTVFEGPRAGPFRSGLAGAMLTVSGDSLTAAAT